MTIPVDITVSLNFADSPSFGIPLTLDDPVNGILGTNVLADNASLIVDLSSSTTQISIKRGKDILTDNYNSGSALIRVLDPLGYFNPTNTSSPYYGYVKPLRKLRISATNTAGLTVYLFSGYTSEYRYTYPQGQETGYVTIAAYDAFKIFNLAAITTVTGSSIGQGTGTRIDKILDTISWPAGMRDIDAGNTTCQADPATSRVALSAIKVLENTEQGAFYISPEGTAIFQDRNFTIATAGGTPIIFAQDASGLNYANLKFSFDDKLIYNQSTMTRVGGTAQVASDSASIDTYFLHSMALSNLMMQTDADALNAAKAWVASHKDTSIRIDSMTLDYNDPSYTAANINTILGLDYFQPVYITNTTPQGSTITKTLQVQGLSWDITPNSMQCTVTTLEPSIEGFILNSTLYGILGTSVLSY